MPNCNECGKPYSLFDTSRNIGSGVCSDCFVNPRTKDYATFKDELFRTDPMFAYAGEDAFQAAYKAYLHRDNKSQHTGRRGRSANESRRTTAEEQDRKQSASFGCIKCGTGLRVQLPFKDMTYRCPSCRTEYRTIDAGILSPVFLVIPKVEPDGEQAPNSSRRARREAPPRVKAALVTLDLDETATFEQIRQAFRDLVKAYHPDKVAGLGPELRRVAEQKTKEINGAYKLLKEFHAA